MPIEADTRWIIDNNLSNKHWILNPNDKNRNVFFEGDIPNVELNKKLKQLGKRPDYILWDNNTNTPLGIIEAKKGGGDISTAFPQAIEYATILNAPLVFVMNNSYCQTKFITNKENQSNGKPLFINENEVNELIREIEALQFLRDNTNSIYTIDKEVIISRQELIRIFKNLNDVLRGEGLTAGIERLNEFANVLFVKLFCEKNNKLEIWNTFKTTADELLINTFNNSMQTLIKDYDTELFTPLQIKKANTLRDLICRLDKLRFSSINQDVIGDAFEYFLQKATASGNDLGEYFTPRHIVKTMVRLINPLFKEKVYDPFCGTGGFLTESFNYIKENTILDDDKKKTILSKETIYGNEITQNARLCKMNMILHGDGHSGIKRCNTLENPVDKLYDCIITNMPFSQTIVNKVLNHKTGKVEVVNTITGLYENGLAKNNGDGVCLLHCFRAVKDGGRMALVVPEGVLFKKELAPVRKHLLDNAELKTIISLPAGVFEPYTGIKTDILYFVNCHTGRTKDKIWFFEAKSDGFTLNKHRKPTQENDLKKVNFINFKKDNENDIKSIGFELLDFEKVKENNYNLCGAVYRGIDGYSGEFESVKLGEICEILDNKRKPLNSGSRLSIKGNIPYYGANGVVDYINDFIFDDKLLLLAEDGGFWGANEKSSYLIEGKAWVNNHAHVLKFQNDITRKFVCYMLNSLDLTKYISGSTRGKLTLYYLKQIQLPLPPLEKQQEIVAELDKMQAVIDGCKKVIENWKPQIDFNDLLGDSRERERERESGLHRLKKQLKQQMMNLMKLADGL